MKTIETIAAEHGYYNINSLPEHIKEDAYFKSRPEWTSPSFYDIHIPEGVKKLKNVQYGVFVEVREQRRSDGSHELYFAEYAPRLLVFSEKMEIPLMLTFRKDKYVLFPLHSVVNKLQRGTNYRERAPFVDALKEPNRIGAFTDKKVEAWVDYCIDYMNACAKAADAVHEKEQANLATIEDFIKRAQCKSVQRHGKYTTVKTNLFTVDFEMEDGGAYLRTKIRFEGNLETLINNKL